MARHDPNVDALRGVATRSTSWVPFLGSYTTSLYNQRLQRDLYEYQKPAYERQLADWNHYVGSQGKTIRYPELSFPGKIRALDTSISESYNSSLGLSSRFTGSAFASGSRRAYRRSSGLYSGLGGYSSRYL